MYAIGEAQSFDNDCSGTQHTDVFRLARDPRFKQSSKSLSIGVGIVLSCWCFHPTKGGYIVGATRGEKPLLIILLILCVVLPTLPHTDSTPILGPVSLWRMVNGWLGRLVSGKRLIAAREWDGLVPWGA